MLEPSEKKAQGRVMENLRTPCCWFIHFSSPLPWRRSSTPTNSCRCQATIEDVFAGGYIYIYIYIYLFIYYLTYIYPVPHHGPLSHHVLILPEE